MFISPFVVTIVGTVAIPWFVKASMAVIGGLAMAVLVITDK